MKKTKNKKTKPKPKKVDSNWLSMDEKEAMHMVKHFDTAYSKYKKQYRDEAHVESESSDTDSSKP